MLSTTTFVRRGDIRVSRWSYDCTRLGDALRLLEAVNGLHVVTVDCAKLGSALHLLEALNGLQVVALQSKEVPGTGHKREPNFDHDIAFWELLFDVFVSFCYLCLI